MGSANPADQLREPCAERAADRAQPAILERPAQLPMHPGAGTGGVQVLSDTQGVDFSSWLLALAPRNRAHLGSADSRRSEPAHPQKGRGRHSLQSAAQRPPHGGQHGPGRPLRRHRRSIAPPGAPLPAQTTRPFPRTSTAPTWNCAPSSSTTWNRRTSRRQPRSSASELETSDSHPLKNHLLLQKILRCHAIVPKSCI